MPEDSDRSRAVAGHLTEWTAPGEEAVVGLDHAELVATQIAHHDVLLSGDWPGVNWGADHPFASYPARAHSPSVTLQVGRLHVPEACPERSRS